MKCLAVRGFLVVMLLAALAACGGGSVVPGGVPTSTFGSTPTPGTTPTPVPTPATLQMTLGASPQTTAFPTLTTGYGLNFTVPAANATVTAAVAFSTILPSGFVTVASLARAPHAIGGSPTALAYVSFTPAATVTFNSTFGFAFSLQAAPASGSQYAMGWYSPAASSQGWQYLVGPVAASGASVTFVPTASSAITLQAGTTYVFTLYGIAPPTSPTPAPTPAASASPTPVVVSNGGVLALQLSSASASARSAGVTVNGAPLATVTMPPGCSSTCMISVSAPAGTGEQVRVATYLSADGSGLPLSITLPITTSVVASQTTTANAPLMPAASSLRFNFSPLTFTNGVAIASSSFVLQPYDANGVALGAYGSYLDPDGNYPSYVTVSPESSWATPRFTIAIDPRYASGFLQYSGVAVSAETLEVYDFNSPRLTGTTTVSFAPPPYGSPHFAVSAVGYQPTSGSCPNTQHLCGDSFLEEYGANASSPLRSFVNLGYSYKAVGGFGRPLFDPNGVLWALDGSLNGGLVGFLPDARSVHMPLSAPYGDMAMQFDTSGRLYVSHQNATVNIYSIDASYNPTLVRSISIPNATICDATSDSAGTVFVAQCSIPGQTPSPGGIWAFSATSGSGTIGAAAFAGAYSAPMRVDSTGNVYATSVDGRRVVRWTAGTFGSSSPTVVADESSVLATYQFITDFAVASNGDGCGVIQPYPTMNFQWGAGGTVCPSRSLIDFIAAPLH